MPNVQLALERKTKVAEHLERGITSPAQISRATGINVDTVKNWIDKINVEKGVAAVTEAEGEEFKRRFLAGEDFLSISKDTGAHPYVVSGWLAERGIFSQGQLSPEQVEKVRDQYINGIRVTDLGYMYGVPATYISQALSVLKTERRPHDLPEETHRQIAELFKIEKNIGVIAESMRMSPKTVAKSLDAQGLRPIARRGAGRIAADETSEEAGSDSEQHASTAERESAVIPIEMLRARPQGIELLENVMKIYELLEVTIEDVQGLGAYAAKNIFITSKMAGNVEIPEEYMRLLRSVNSMGSQLTMHVANLKSERKALQENLDRLKRN